MFYYSFLSRKIFWEVYLRPKRQSPVFCGDGAAGAKPALLLWRKARPSLVVLSFLLGECFLTPTLPKACENNHWLYSFFSSSSCSFQDKLYLLSSQEAHQKFLTNPREYLLPPMPRAPCRVSITGAPLTGKSTLCRLVAQHYGAVVLDVEELLQPVLAEAEEERLLKIKVVTTRFAIEKIQESNEDILGELLIFCAIFSHFFIKVILVHYVIFPIISLWKNILNDLYFSLFI